jgi:pimeloyl-ACP methyl ester carboxylesterase
VVLLHGLASSFDHNWREPGWVELLTEAGRDVLEIDLPGHGRGPHETVPEAYADVPGAVARRIAEQAPEARQLDAVGFSLGGHTLMIIAAAAPERFRRLAVLGVGDGALAPPSGSTHAVLAEALSAATEPEGDPARLLWRLTRSAGNDPAAMAAFVRRVTATLDADALARISCPVLVVIGERDFAGPADALAAALPQARLEVLRGTDHFGTTSDYRCIGAVLDFLDA